MTAAEKAAAAAARRCSPGPRSRGPSRSPAATNRADATVVKISNLTTRPKVGAPVDVGSEPTGVALSPTGKRLVVAELAEGRISVIDTDTMKVTRRSTSPITPRRSR